MRLQINAGSAAVIGIAHALKNCRGKRPQFMIILKTVWKVLTGRGAY
ncbi:MAG: hypothetical protein K9J81_10830 [Desulfohalobiaceae bacterium]|nr:hypothetical protein [Desulfohalobiaceae bacterium]